MQSHRSGKARDLSTPWSEYVWDDRGYWYSSRNDPSGVVEYDYRYPDAPQNTQEQQSTPRTLGAGIISEPEPPEPVLSASGGGAQYRADVNTANTAGSSGNFGGPLIPENANYQHTAQTTYDSPASYYSTSGPQHSQASNTSGFVGSGAPEDYKVSRDIVPNLRRLSFTPSASIPEQATLDVSGQHPALPPNVKTIKREAGSENWETLDPRYHAVDERNQRKFWKVGRVFMMLWTEPARDQHTSRGGATSNGSHFSTTYLGGTAYTEIRRFVVIREGWGNSICSPIHTYSGQATLKPNLPDPQQHAIIFSSENVPKEYSYYTEDGTFVTENLSKDPIRVKREQVDAEGDLGELSRLNYSKIYTVENYVRVLNIGMVHQDSMESLNNNCFLRPRTEPPGKPRDKLSKGGSSHKDKKKSKDSDKKHRGSRS